MKQNLLITGSGGFLGYHLKQQFAAIKHSFNLFMPRSTEVNLFDLQALIDYCNHNKITHILAASAVCAGILGNVSNPGYFLYANSQMALNTYEAARICNIKYVYGIGSVCMYPKYCPVPFKEDYILGDFPEDFRTVGNYPESTNAPYSIGKKLLMMLGSTYRQQYGIKGAFLIPVNLYGQRDKFDLTTGHVIPALIRKFDHAKATNQKVVECYGSGKDTSREFLFGEDAAEVIVKTICSDFDNPLPINLGTGNEIKIVDLAHLIAELIDYTGDIVFNGKLDGQPRRCLDLTRCKEFLGWEAKTSLRDGLIKTISWYRENKAEIFAKEKS